MMTSYEERSVSIILPREKKLSKIGFSGDFMKLHIYVVGQIHTRNPAPYPPISEQQMLLLPTKLSRTQLTPPLASKALGSCEAA